MAYCGRYKTGAPKWLDQNDPEGALLIMIKPFGLDFSGEEAICHGAAATMYVDWEKVRVCAIFWTLRI